MRLRVGRRILALLPFLMFFPNVTFQAFSCATYAECKVTWDNFVRLAYINKNDLT